MKIRRGYTMVRVIRRARASGRGSITVCATHEDDRRVGGSVEHGWHDERQDDDTPSPCDVCRERGPRELRDDDDDGGDR